MSSLGPIPTPGIPPAAIGLPPSQPSRRQSLSAVPPRGPPPMSQLGMKPPDGGRPDSLNRRITSPQLPKGPPPRGPPPRGPPPRGPPHGPPGFNNDRPSLSGKLFPLESYNESRICLTSHVLFYPHRTRQTQHSQ
jgi:WW domain-binding protein 11